MVSRTGILSNAFHEENCMDYKILPLGFANTNYAGGLSNPFLQGIKTPKYIRAAAKPISADVAAVSEARLMGGNRAANARAMLDLFRKEGSEWTPPPIDLDTINRNAKDLADNAARSAVSILPRTTSGTTRGTLSLKQTIGVDAVALELLTNKYMAKYNSMSSGRQAIVGQDILDRAIKDNVDLFRFDLRTGENKIQSGVLKGKGSSASPSTGKSPMGGEGTRPQMVRTAIRAFYTMNSNVDLNQIFGMMPSSLAAILDQQKRTSTRSAASGSSDSGGTSESGATTVQQQGIALAAETPLPQEYQKK